MLHNNIGMKFPLEELENFSANMKKNLQDEKFLNYLLENMHKHWHNIDWFLNDIREEFENIGEIDEIDNNFTLDDLEDILNEMTDDCTISEYLILKPNINDDELINYEDDDHIIFFIDFVLKDNYYKVARERYLSSHNENSDYNITTDSTSIFYVVTNKNNQYLKSFDKYSGKTTINKFMNDNKDIQPILNEKEIIQDIFKTLRARVEYPCTFGILNDKIDDVKLKDILDRALNINSEVKCMYSNREGYTLSITLK